MNKLNIRELGYQICEELYDFFAMESFNYGQYAVDRLTNALSITHKQAFNPAFIKYLIKSFLKDKLISLNYSPSWRDEKKVELIVKDREVALKDLKDKLFSQASFFRSDITISLKNSLYKVIFDLVCQGDKFYESNLMFDLFANHYLFINNFPNYSLLTNYFGDKFVRMVQDIYEVPIEFEKSFRECEILCDKPIEQNEPLTVIRHLVNLLNNWTNITFNEDLLRTFSYYLSLQCGEYVKETFIEHIFTQLANFNFSYLKEYSHWGRYFHYHRHSENWKNVESIIETVARVPYNSSIYKENATNDPIFRTLKLLKILNSNIKKPLFEDELHFYSVFEKIFQLIEYQDYQEYQVSGLEKIIYELTENTSLSQQIVNFFIENSKTENQISTIIEFNVGYARNNYLHSKALIEENNINILSDNHRECTFRCQAIDNVYKKLAQNNEVKTYNQSKYLRIITQSGM